MEPLIVDALASGRGKRLTTRDAIGAGPRSLAGVLEGKGLEPRIALAESFLGGDVSLVGHDLLMISGMTSDFMAVRRVVSKWRAESSGPVLIGGPIASEPRRALLKGGADLCVVGEGEFTIRELLDLGLVEGTLPCPEALADICGTAYMNGKAVRVNPLRPVMRREVYEGLTPSTETVVDYPLHRSARVYVEVLRGCSNYQRAQLGLADESCVDCGRCRTGSFEERYYCPVGILPGCGYCSVPSLFGPTKSRSSSGVAREVSGLLSKGVRRIVLTAPDFLDYGRDLLVEPEPLTDPRHPEPNYDALEELLSRLVDLDAVADRDASIMVENIKASLVTPEAAQLLGQYLTGTPVNIGFETGSEEHSLGIGRPSTPDENLRALRRLKAAGLKPYAYFIHGLPGQSAETVEETVETIGRSVDAGASRIILYRFQPLPMSAFHDRPKAPPASRDRLGRRIYDTARRANLRLKEDMRGHRVRVVVAEPYDRDRRYHVAYPMLHGPVVLVDGAEGLDGKVVEVEVAGVASDRMVQGRLLGATF